MSGQIVHTVNHEADVTTFLGLGRVGGNAGLAGIEIEVGWTSDAKRALFLKDLDRFKYGEACISKHDGTIGARGDTSPSEIVSKPMTFADLRKFAENVGKVIESRVDKGLITTGCGIHIHASEGLFEKNALWRYAAAICQDGTAVNKWVSPKSSEAAKELTRNSAAVHDFWNDACLRGATQHSARTPYMRVEDIPTTKAHSRAFIHGKSTPTFETRIFRTPKSHRVLMSYIDIVESLLGFSTLTDYVEEEKDTPQAVIDALLKEIAMPMRTHRNPDTQQSFVYDPETGDAYELEAAQSARGDWYAPAAVLKKRGLCIPTQEQLRIVTSARNGKGAAGWQTGTMPLKEYIKYVIAHGDRWPHLAKRLSYDKFTAYLDGSAGRREYPHRDKPHLEYNPGCLVRLEGERGQKFTLMYKDAMRSGIPHWAVGSEEGGGPYNYPVNLLIHACKGALEVGGEV